MRRGCAVLWAACGVLLGCGGQAGDVALPVEGWTPRHLDAGLVAQAAFADEGGGGLFVLPDGGVQRLRADASRAPLEAHPHNTVAPGAALGLFALGPSTAVVDTAQGSFTAQAGWLVETPWRDALPGGGLRASVLAPDGAAWLVHEVGVFRLANGALTTLTLEGAAVTGVTAAAAGPAPDGADALWLARGNELLVASLVSGQGLTVRPAGLDAKELKSGLQGLAGLAPTADSRGEVLVANGALLHRFDGRAWTRWRLPAPATALRATGRFAWLAAGGALYRYHADVERWQRVDGLDAPAELLACDSAGTAWVRVGEATVALSTGVTPRLDGLQAGERLFGPEHTLAAVLPRDQAPTAVDWHFDGSAEQTVDAAAMVPGAGPLAAFSSFALAGLDAAGAMRPVVLNALGDGPHALYVTAHFQGGAQTTRVVHFSLTLGEGAEVSWARDIRPLSEARCARCHSAGTSPELSTYEAWMTNAEAAARAVKEKRMPADGPLDAAGIQLVQRWVTGGMKP